MSSDVVASAIHIVSVDVGEELNENGSKTEISCDSGIETVDSCATMYLLSSDSDVSPIKTSDSPLNDTENGALENDNTSEVSSPTSLSENKSFLNVYDSETPVDSKTESIIDIHNITNTTCDIESIADTKVSNENHAIDINVDKNGSGGSLNTVSCILNSINNLTTSTVSLNEQSHEENVNINLSTLSRSAENISVFDNTLTISSASSSTKDLDKEQILSEFSNQKSKVSATQKIVPENQHSLDVKYGRLPKEILSQDIGSIVKNVHGIFSSVSGSLKNAYNNSHRPSIQRHPNKNIKPMTNGKIMNDIFEDVVDEKINESMVVKPAVEEPSLNLEPVLNPSQDGDENDSKKDMLKLQIESLERVLFEQRKENASLRERVKQQVDELQAKDHTFKELETKVDLMCKRAELAQKEKDAAVMRYASTECAAIEARKAADAASKAEKAAVAEQELLSNKLRTAREEKQRICQLYDDKCHELQNSEREMAKVREELREIEGRLKWTQSKLRMEMDAYKDSAEKAEKLSQQVAELEAAREAAVVNSAELARAKQLELDLKESQAALILCRHEKEDLDRRLTAALQQLDSCKKEKDEATSSLALANTQVEELKQNNLRLEEEAAELAALRAQAALADTLGSQLQRETERARAAEESLSTERARAETCARREAGALEHAARLTALHVAERARAADHEAKAQALAADNVSLRESTETLQNELTRLQTALEEETDRRNKENRVLARKVAELTEEAAEANKKLEWEEGENSVLKKKHSSAIKELNRELQRAMKRVEQLEAKLPQNDATSTRTGSVSSLSSGETPQEEHSRTDTLPDVQPREPERQALIERIVSLQRALARRAERCDFLEEHCTQLTTELRGKAKLLRVLLPSLPAGALASQQSDTHKKEIARLGGGAMAALWGGDSGGMTLELSLEMNKRLQAVLEDTLLKNITLKENMDTLGEEIARLRDSTKAVEKK